MFRPLVSNDLAEPDSARQRILSVATELFAAQGFGQVSIREIASKSGVSVSTVMYHGGSKQKLLEACLDEAFSGNTSLIDLMEHLESEELSDQASFFSVYDRIVEVAIEQATDFPMIRRLWWRLLLDHPEIFRTLEGKHVRKIYQNSLRFLNAARRAGWIRGDVKELSLFLSSLDWILDGFFVGGLIEPEGSRSSPGDPRQLDFLESWLKQYGRKLLALETQ